jgi:DNA-binding winged helix-turn-helix (wHTH) protein
MDLEFGNYRLKRAERLLLGPEGPVELSARSFDILAMLLERPDDVIGKTELWWWRKTRCRCMYRRCAKRLTPA